MRTVNGAINTLRWWRCITIVVFQFCRWMRIRQHDRPNDPGRIFSFSVCVYTSVWVCVLYVFVFVSVSPRVWYVHANTLSGGRHDKKTPRSLWAFCFLFFFSSSSSTSCVAPLGKVKSKQRGDARCIVLESITGLLSQTCLPYFSHSSFSPTLINGILGASQESTKSLSHCYFTTVVMHLQASDIMRV